MTKCAVLLCLLFLLNGPAISEQPSSEAEKDKRPLAVNLIFSGEGEPYRDFQRGFTSRFEEYFPVEISAHTLSDSDETIDLPSSGFPIAVGTRAASWAFAHLERPFMSVMVPSNTLSRLKDGNEAPSSSGIFIDQPPARHLALIRSLLPQSRKTLLISDGLSLENFERFQAEAEVLSMELSHDVAMDRSQIVRSIQSMDSGTEAILIVPARGAMNSQKLRALLLNSFRIRIPAFGYSSGLVTAGTVAAVYSDPGRIGEESADLLAEIYEKDPKDWPAHQYPRHFKVSTNADVARALRIRLPDNETIEEAIKKMEIANGD